VAFTTWIDGKNRVVVNGRPGEPYDWIGWPPAMSEDGSVLAYAARLGTEQFCVVGDRRGPAYRSVAHPVISPDGKHVAYAAEDDRGAFVVMDGRPGPVFEWAGDVALDGSGRVAYRARKFDRQAVVVEGSTAGPPFERVTRPFFLPDGSVAYGAREDGRWQIVCGDRRTAAECEISQIFDGGHVFAEEGGYRVCVEGRAGPRYDWIGWPTRLADGRAAYFGSRGGSKALVVGDRELDLGACLVSNPVFGRSEVTFVSLKGRRLWLRTVCFLDGD
jgi:hypothetical protein